MTRRGAKLGVTKSKLYSVGVFTIATDLRAIVECIGIENTRRLADALNNELQRNAKSTKGKASRRVNNKEQQAPMLRNLSDYVKQEVARQISIGSKISKPKTKRKAA